MKKIGSNCLKFSFLNLFIVALLGTLMRYKIGFEFPYFDQKHIQHSHSHFAFAGWITHTIYVLLVFFLQNNSKAPLNEKRYNLLLSLNLISAYAMLIAFFMFGYNAISITFSTLSVITGYAFSYFFIKDLKKLTQPNLPANWFRAALLLNVLSSAGTFALAYMMATKNLHQDWYLASVYYYLHFQYNGFFIFSCFGLFISRLDISETYVKPLKHVFILYCLAVVPAYFLSTLWMKLPVWLYSLVIIAAVLQCIAWAKFLWVVAKNRVQIQLPRFANWLFLLVAASMSIKLLLQLGSVIPQVSKLAFGFRNIVIAYLHLILLAVITGFLLAYIFSYILKNQPKKIIAALWIFTFGVYLNELILGIIGIASFSYNTIPYGHIGLLVAALIMLIGVFILVFTRTDNEKNHGILK